MTLNNWVYPLVILGSALVAMIAAAGLLPEPAQSLSIFWFLLMCPGLAYVPLFGFGPMILEFVIALGASFGLNTLVTLALVMAGAWSMQTALLIMLGITILGVCLQLARHWPVLRQRLW